MRTVAYLVLVATVVAALWLVKPQLFGKILPDSMVEAPAKTTAPASESATTEEISIAQQITKDAAVVAPADQPMAVHHEAQHYVDRLTKAEAAPVSVERADHFVAGDQMLQMLPETATVKISASELQNSGKLAPDTPITIVKTIEQVERASPSKLIADSAGNLDSPVMQVLMDDSIHQTTVRAVLELLRKHPQNIVRVLRKVEYYEQTTPAQLMASEILTPDMPITIVKGRHGLELISVRDLIPRDMLTPDSLFYVRTVRETDSQGIWGIVHDGIIRNFAQGMAIRRGHQVNTYRVDIPYDADEQYSNASSSYLGRLIFKKTKSSFIYNLRENRMGTNPDRITPGQEIVIINFEPDELIDIYKHFVNKQG